MPSILSAARRICGFFFLLNIWWLYQWRFSVIQVDLLGSWVTRKRLLKAKSLLVTFMHPESSLISWIKKKFSQISKGATFMCTHFVETCQISWNQQSYPFITVNVAIIIKWSSIQPFHFQMQLLLEHLWIKKNLLSFHPIGRTLNFISDSKSKLYFDNKRMLN